MKMLELLISCKPFWNSNGSFSSANIYLSKVSDRNSRKRNEISLKLTLTLSQLGFFMYIKQLVWIILNNFLNLNNFWTRSATELKFGMNIFLYKNFLKKKFKKVLHFADVSIFLWKTHIFLDNFLSNLKLL